MRRLFFIVVLFGFSVVAYAQWIPQGHLDKAGSHLELDGKRLSQEEQDLLLSNVNGVNYSKQWAKATVRKRLFLGEFVLGGASIAGGLSMFAVHFLPFALGSIFSGARAKGDPDETKRIKAQLREEHLPGIRYSIIPILAGSALLSTGISFHAKYNRFMNNVVDYYNGDEERQPELGTRLLLGPTPNGFGLALQF